MQESSNPTAKAQFSTVHTMSYFNTQESPQDPPPTCYQFLIITDNWRLRLKHVLAPFGDSHCFMVPYKLSCYYYYYFYYYLLFLFSSFNAPPAQSGGNNSLTELLLLLHVLLTTVQIIKCNRATFNIDFGKRKLCSLSSSASVISTALTTQRMLPQYMSSCPWKNC